MSLAVSAPRFSANSVRNSVSLTRPSSAADGFLLQPSLVVDAAWLLVSDRILTTILEQGKIYRLPENEEDDAVEDESARNLDDEEDAEQQNLAKKVARRARMKNLLGGDERGFAEGARIEQNPIRVTQVSPCFLL